MRAAEEAGGEGVRGVGGEAPLAGGRAGADGGERSRGKEKFQV